MHSVLKVVTVEYGLNDAPEPLFQCPVVVDPKLLRMLNGTTKTAQAIVRESASAVELVGRFERSTRHVDFAPRLALVIGALPVALPLTLVMP